VVSGDDMVGPDLERALGEQKMARLAGALLNAA